MSPASGPSLSNVCRALAMARMTPCMAGVNIIWETTWKAKLEAKFQSRTFFSNKKPQKCPLYFMSSGFKRNHTFYNLCGMHSPLHCIHQHRLSPWSCLRWESLLRRPRSPAVAAWLEHPAVALHPAARLQAQELVWDPRAQLLFQSRGLWRPLHLPCLPGGQTTPG